MMQLFSIPRVFSFKDVKWLTEKLEEAIGFGPYVYENEVGNYVIRIRSADSPRFLKYIGNPKLACFDYKFDVKGKHKRKKWLESEDRFLRENYGEKTAEEIAEKLSRSPSSVFHRANRLELEGR